MGFPRVREPPQRGELGGGSSAGKHGERAAGVDRPALQVVADQQDLRTGGLGLEGERGQGAGVGPGRLIDDDQLRRGERPAALLGNQSPLGPAGVPGGEVVGGALDGALEVLDRSGAAERAVAGGLVQPLRGGLAVDTEGLAEGVGGGRRRGQPYDRANVLLPELGQSGEGCGLAGPGRSDERVQGAAGGDDRLQRGHLIRG